MKDQSYILFHCFYVFPFYGNKSYFSLGYSDLLDRLLLTALFSPFFMVKDCLFVKYLPVKAEHFG